jgi:hypothetical protein
MECLECSENEKAKLDANTQLLKSKSFVLYTIDDNNQIEVISFDDSLKLVELLGLLTYINQDSAQRIDIQTSDEEEDVDID